MILRDIITHKPGICKQEVAKVLTLSYVTPVFRGQETFQVRISFLSSSPSCHPALLPQTGQGSQARPLS